MVHDWIGFDYLIGSGPPSPARNHVLAVGQRPEGAVELGDGRHLAVQLHLGGLRGGRARLGLLPCVWNGVMGYGID